MRKKITTEIGFLKTIKKITIFFLYAFLFTSCTRNANDEKMNAIEVRVDSLEKFVQEIKSQNKPRLADLMFGIHAHYVKLWFEGAKENWQFAQYEMDKMKDGFASAREIYPTFEQQPIAELIPQMMLPSIDSLQQAIRENNKERFMVRFNILTNSCNNCHSITRHEFNVIKVPMQNDGRIGGVKE